MNSERGIRKDATREVYQWYGAIVIAGVGGKAGASMYVVCLGVLNARRRTGKAFVHAIGFRPMGFEPAPPG